MKKIPQHPDFPVSEKIYRRLLRAYPKAHRAEYGPAMAQLFRDQCRDAWNESHNWGVMKLWMRVLPDLASTSILERLAAMKGKKSMNDKLANLFGFRTVPAMIFFRVFVAVFLLVLVTSVVITFIMPEGYASTARIKVEQDAAATPSVSAGYDPYFLQKTFEIIQSPVVLDPVIEKLKLNEKWGKKYNNGVALKTADTLQILQQRLALQPVRNTELINVTVYSEDRNEAAQIANAVAESYQQYRLKLQMDLAMKKIEPLRNQFQQEENQIQQAQTDLETLRQQFNIASDATVSQSPQEKPYWEKKREVENMIEFHKLLQRKITAETIDASLPKMLTVTFIDKAKPGQAPVRPNKPLNIAFGAGLGILLALVIGGISALASFLIRKRACKIPSAA
jgi:capsular polysaccharide biosynthesis protein